MREFVKTEDMNRNGKGNQNTEKNNIGAGGYAMESRNSTDFGLPETKSARRMSNRRNESKKKTKKGNSKEQIVVTNREGPKRRSAQRKGRRLSQRFFVGCGNMTGSRGVDAFRQR